MRRIVLLGRKLAIPIINNDAVAKVLDSVLRDHLILLILEGDRSTNRRNIFKGRTSYGLLRLRQHAREDLYASGLIRQPDMFIFTRSFIRRLCTPHGKSSMYIISQHYA